MKFEKWNATFGKLDKARLTLAPGLNLIQGDNEAGKSTLSAFLRAMLYGVPTNQRDKAGFLAEKNRYQPWSGAPMEGDLLVEWQGREVLLRRGPKGNSPFGAFQAVDAHTGEAIPELTAAAAGEALIGAEREVFERSAFVGQANLSVDGSPALEKRIGALLTAGQEEVSYSQVDRRLKDWLNRRKHNKTGRIPALEEEIARQEALLERFRHARRQREEGLAGLEDLRTQKAELEQEKADHKTLAFLGKWEQYKKAYEEHQAAKAAYEETAAHFQNLPSPEALMDAQVQLQQVQTLNAQVKAKQAQVEEFRLSTAKEPEKARLSGGQVALSMLMGLGVMLGVFALLVFMADLPGSGSAASLAEALTWSPMDFATRAAIALASGLAVGIGVGILCLGRNKKQNAAQSQTDWETELAHLEEELTSLTGEKETRFTELLAFVHTFAPTVTNEFGITAALSRSLHGENRLEPMRERLEAAERVLEMARAALGPDPQPPTALPPTPERPYQETVARLAVVNEALSRQERMVAAAEGELRSLGDPDRVDEALEQAREELSRRREEYDALEQAIDALSKANSTLHQRFNPSLNQRASEILRELTGGKYDTLTLSRTFEAMARQTDAVLPRSVLSLSQGTADQLYLAVRLAVCDLTLPQNDPPPLILDDALANFDEERMALALEHLRKRGERQQILLFTCHKREAQWVGDKPDVNVITL